MRRNRSVRRHRAAVGLDTGEKELYDERADPYELRNRIDDPGLAATRSRLARQLAALTTGAGAGAGGAPTSP